MSPVRQLREAIASALKPLGIETHDVLPETVNPPAVTVGLAGLNTSRAQSSMGKVFMVEVTLVGERADFHDTQVHLDDLQWDIWTALETLPNVWPLSMESATITAGGQDYPGVIYAVEAPRPC